MPPFALILCSAAAVLGTLAATALSLDERACVGAGLVTLCALAFSGSCKPRQFRALLLATLAAATLNAEVRHGSQPRIAERRTAAYSGTVLERSASGILIGLAPGGLRVRARTELRVHPALAFDCDGAREQRRFAVGFAHLAIASARMGSRAIRPSASASRLPPS